MSRHTVHLGSTTKQNYWAEKSKLLHQVVSYVTHDCSEVSLKEHHKGKCYITGKASAMRTRGTNNSGVSTFKQRAGTIRNVSI